MPKPCALIVDDNEINRDIFCASIGAAGYEVDQAINGQDALDKINHKDYHLIILDMQMPIMDGGTALRKLRYDLGKTDLVILVITANPHMIDEEIADLADHVMNKPIDVSQLQQLAERLA